MGIISASAAIGKVQKIKKGGTESLSIADITNLITNLPDAKKNLTGFEFTEVYKQYREFQKCKTQIPMNARDYCNTAMKIIEIYDAIAPYEKYSGGSETELSFMMKDFRTYKKEENIIEELNRFSDYLDSKSIERYVSYIQSNSIFPLDYKTAKAFVGILYINQQKGKGSALQYFHELAEYETGKDPIKGVVIVGFFSGLLYANGVVSKQESDAISQKYMQLQRESIMQNYKPTPQNMNKLKEKTQEKKIEDKNSTTHKGNNEQLEEKNNSIYIKAVKTIRESASIDALKNAIEELTALNGWKESNEYIELGYDKIQLLKEYNDKERLRVEEVRRTEAEARARQEEKKREEDARRMLEQRKAQTYIEAVKDGEKAATVDELDAVISVFRSLENWKDSKSRITWCEKKKKQIIEKIKEEERIAQERAEKQEKWKKISKTALIIFFSLFGVFLFTYYLAVGFTEKGNFSYAKTSMIFGNLYDYYDDRLIDYVCAGIEYENENFEKAKTDFAKLRDYKQAKDYYKKCKEALYIDIESVVFDPESLELYVGEKRLIRTETVPENPTNPKYNLKVKDNEIATYHAKCVTALSAGETTIQAIQNGNVISQCPLIVKDIEPTAINFSQKTFEAKCGRKYTPDIQIEPKNSTDLKYTLTSSNKSVAVILNGEIKCIHEGTATITLTHTSTGLTASQEINVTPIAIESFLIANSEIMSIGERAELLAKYYPEDTPDKELTWSSSNTYVLSIENGYLIANHEGTAVLYAQHKSGLSDSITVKVEPVSAKSISINSTKGSNITEGSKTTLLTSFNPSNTTNKTIQWTCSDYSVAMVTSSGEVTGLKPGTVTISAMTSNGVTATKEITVKPKPVAQSNGFIVKPTSECLNELTINAPKDSACYVIMKPSSLTVLSSYPESYSVFVNQGSSVTLNVPSGRYNVYYASGDTWYGKDYLFGDNTQTFRMDDNPDSPLSLPIEVNFKVEKESDGYYRYTVYELTLYSVENGNVDSLPISKDSFPIL